MDRKIEKIKKLFLENLPTKRHAGEICVDWILSIGYKIKFIYDDLEGELEIINYDSKTRYLYIKYLNKEPFKIHVENFIKCKIGKLLGIRTNEFKIEVGANFVDCKRDITIIDRKIMKRDNDDKGRNWKSYKYKCNKCGTEDWMEESGLLHTKGGCNTCRINAPSKLGHNTIWDKARWMVALGVSEEDAKTNASQSSIKIYVTCPDCGKEKTMMISNIYKRHSIGCTCSDKISYPNKFAYSLLDQLDEIYKFSYIEHEYSPEWIDKKRYDNYFIHNGKEYILEMDGKWHKEYNDLSGQTIEQSKDIDDYKDRLAKEHGIEVVRIDCDYQQSNAFKLIKQNIILGMPKTFDLSIIDWNKCEGFALSNLVKVACDYWNDGICNTKEIAKTMNMGRNTIIEYLKKGSLIKWCNYDAKLEMKKNGTRNGLINGLKTGKPVEIFKDDISLGVFPSCTDLTRKSQLLFGIKLSKSSISLVCNGNKLQYNGFTFKYIEKEVI